jgi:hypothetical protein
VSGRPYPEDIDPQSQCRLPLPRRDELDAEAQLVYDSLADPRGGSLRGLRGRAASICTARRWHAILGR